MEIRVAEHVSDEERRRIFGWGEDVFGVDQLNLRWRPKDLHLLGYVDGRAETHVGLLGHTVSVGDRDVRVCGVGGVVTALASHGKGYAGLAMRYAGTFMCREWEVDFGLLFRRDPSVTFYERMGWQKLPGPVEVEQPEGAVPSPLNVMVLPCGAPGAWPAGPVKLNSFPW